MALIKPMELTSKVATDSEFSQRGRTYLAPPNITSGFGPIDRVFLLSMVDVATMSMMNRKLNSSGESRSSFDTALTDIDLHRLCPCYCRNNSYSLCPVPENLQMHRNLPINTTEYIYTRVVIDLPLQCRRATTPPSLRAARPAPPDAGESGPPANRQFDRYQLIISQQGI